MAVGPPGFDWFPLLLSLKVAAVATLLALVGGTALGWLFARVRFFGSGVLEAVLMLPMVLPPTVIGWAEAASDRTATRTTSARRSQRVQAGIAWPRVNAARRSGSTPPARRSTAPT